MGHAEGSGQMPRQASVDIVDDRRGHTRGFQSLKDQNEYQPLYLAGLSRAIGDWILGMNATRLYTLKYGQYRQVLSIGRVQTPTLALIVNRQKEIDNFKPEPYWYCQRYTATRCSRPLRASLRARKKASSRSTR